MGLEQGSSVNTTFLSVSFGKIRQKKTDSGDVVTSETPGAKKRVTQSGNDSWAIEYDSVFGYIEKVTYKEDREYGNSYEVTMVDGADSFQLSIKEKGNFSQPFLSVLPNAILTQPLRISVWDYENKMGKKKIGLSIEQDNNPNANEFGGKNIVANYYGKWEDDTFVPLHGFPSSKGVNWQDEDSRDEFNLKVRKFLKGEFRSKFEGKFNSAPEPRTKDSIVNDAKDNSAGNSDLPWDNEPDQEPPF